MISYLFFFNDTATTEIYTLSLHDALPISQCREGTAWTTKILERILSGQGKTADLDLLLDLADNMTGKTICVLSDSCAAPVVSGIKKFKHEFEDYIAGRRKPLLVA